jgi:hypothetical protein
MPIHLFSRRPLTAFVTLFTAALALSSCVPQRFNGAKTMAERQTSRFGPVLPLRDAKRLPPTLAEEGTELTQDSNGFVTAESFERTGWEILKGSSYPPPIRKFNLTSGQEVHARERTGTERIVMKPGGWWVTPIHATLIASSGKVLFTGWGRRDRDRLDPAPGADNGTSVCDAPDDASHYGSRRYGVSFVFDPMTANNDSQNARAAALQIDSVREAVKAEAKPYSRQAYYCAGHVPLSDGKILYTGGSQYKNLGAQAMHKIVPQGTEQKLEADPDANEQELGLDYAKIFDPNKKSNSAAAVAGAFSIVDGLVYQDNLGPDVSGDNSFADSKSIAGTKKHVNTMWYPTNTRLPKNRVLVIGGNYRWASNRSIANRSIQILNYNCIQNPGSCKPEKVWDALSRHDFTPTNLSPGTRDYVHSILLPDPLKTPCEQHEGGASDAGGKNSYHVLMSGWNGEYLLIDTENDTAGESYRGFDKTPTAKRFCKPPKGRRPMSLSASGDPEGEAPAWSSSSLLLPSGEILRMGGTSDPRISQRVDIFNPYHADCRNIKAITDGRVQTCQPYRFIHTGITRISPAALLLPDGKVLITSGWADGIAFDQRDSEYAQDENARRRMQIIDPEAIAPSQSAGADSEPGWISQPMASADNYRVIKTRAQKETGTAVFTEDPWPDQVNERGYHNIALLLKDGRVLLGGGTHANGSVGCEHPTLRIYSPPYLDNPAARPQIKAENPQVTLKIGSDAVSLLYTGKALRPSKKLGAFGRSGVVLMAPGSMTHSFDQNQRYVGLRYETVTDASDGDAKQIKVFPPETAFQAPAGEYLLFLVSEDGIPSEAVTIKVVE